MINSARFFSHTYTPSLLSDRLTGPGPTFHFFFFFHFGGLARYLSRGTRVRMLDAVVVAVMAAVLVLVDGTRV
jgi:hypothetical protein